MVTRFARDIAWVALSILLLAFGFAAVVWGGVELGAYTGSIERGLSSQVLASTYFRVVLFKGLLPQLLLALALHATLGRPLPRLQTLPRLALAVALSYAIVAPLLLTADLPGWPALQLQTWSHHLGTGALMIAGVTATAWTGRRLAYARAAGA